MLIFLIIISLAAGTLAIPSKAQSFAALPYELTYFYSAYIVEYLAWVDQGRRAPMEMAPGLSENLPGRRQANIGEFINYLMGNEVTETRMMPGQTHFLDANGNKRKLTQEMKKARLAAGVPVAKDPDFRGHGEGMNTMMPTANTPASVRNSFSGKRVKYVRIHSSIKIPDRPVQQPGTPRLEGVAVLQVWLDVLEAVGKTFSKSTHHLQRQNLMTDQLRGLMNAAEEALKSAQGVRMKESEFIAFDEGLEREIRQAKIPDVDKRMLVRKEFAFEVGGVLVKFDRYDVEETLKRIPPIFAPADLGKESKVDKEKREARNRARDLIQTWPDKHQKTSVSNTHMNIYTRMSEERSWLNTACLRP